MIRSEFPEHKAPRPDLAELLRVVLPLQQSLSISRQTKGSLELLLGCAMSEFCTPLEHLWQAGVVGYDTSSGTWLPAGAEQLRSAIDELGGGVSAAVIARHCGVDVAKVMVWLDHLIGMGLVREDEGEFHVVDLRGAS